MTVTVVSSGVTSNGITLTAGNDLEVFGRTLYTTIDSGGVEAVFAGGAAVASTINDGAQEVTSGGEAILTTVGSGGLEIVMTGSEAALTTVEAGGYELIWGGVGIGATLSGGIETVELGGVASATTVSAGGTLTLGLLGNGTAVGATLDAGGRENLFNEGTASGTTVNFGAEEFVSGGTARGTTINAGTDIAVGGGGTYETTVSGSEITFRGFHRPLVLEGEEIVSSGGAAVGTNVDPFGEQIVSSGGIAFGTVVNNGGEQIVASGGVAFSDTVYGYELVQAGGEDTAVTISSGTFEVASGGSTGGNPVTFDGGGKLVLDASASFGGLVAGFGFGAYLDLADISFGSGTSVAFTEAASNTSGTLTVTDGTHTANIALLGQYITNQFATANDGNGGTLITETGGWHGVATLAAATFAGR
jgi:autotransporter passenger strand-loop-strand repeat protein